MFVATKLFHKAGEGSGGGSDPHNLGYYADLTALQTAHPTGTDGDFAILGSTDTIWVWDSGTSAWKDTDTKGQVTSVNGQTGAVTVDTLPSQTGNSGKFLTTNGTTASWGNALTNRSSASGSLAIIGSATQTQAVSIGALAYADTEATAIGYASSAGGTESVAIGWKASASGNYSTAVGEEASASGQSSVALGLTAQATAQNAIQLGSGSNSTANTLNVGLGYVNGSQQNVRLLSNDGTIPTDRLPNAINKYSTMPTAASTNVGWIVQFTGTTDSTYTHGYIYECKAQGTNPETYAWEAVEVQASSGGLPSQTGQSGKFLTTDGTDASWSDKPLVNKATGSNALCIAGTDSGRGNSMCVGLSASARDEGTAVGNSAKTTGNYAVAVGYFASASGTRAIGIGSSAIASANGAVQIGYGTNSTADTLQYKSYRVIDSDGTIPTDRLTKANTTVTLAVADWSSSTQTVSVTGVTATSIVLVAPDSASQSDYTSAGILCTAQGAGTLTFTCSTTPTNAITVNVVAL